MARISCACRPGASTNKAMKHKVIPCPERLRHVPRQFSWIDHRLVREGHIKGRSAGALALYLFLCTVADGQGLSYYSEARIGEMLGVGRTGVRDARAELATAGLIAYQAPFYQVLGLERQAQGAMPCQAPTARSCKVSGVAEILRSMMGEVAP